MQIFTHREFVASLSAEQRKRLIERSDRAGLQHLAAHFSAIGVCSILIVNKVAFWPMLLPVQGVLLVFLFTLLHECVHGTPFLSRWLSPTIASVCGLVLVLPSIWFRYFHYEHHRYTQDPERDPELSTPKPTNLREYLITMSGVPVMWSQWRTMILLALSRQKDSFVPKNKRVDVRREALIMLSVYVLLLVFSLLAGSTLLVWLWFVPMILGQPFLRGYLMTEHTLCPQTSNMLENTRTTTSNALVRFLAWNMPYHIEHHTMPAVPFYQLPKLNGYMRKHLGVVETGYFAFHRKLILGLRR